MKIFENLKRDIIKRVCYLTAKRYGYGSMLFNNKDLDKLNCWIDQAITDYISDIGEKEFLHNLTFVEDKLIEEVGEKIYQSNEIRKKRIPIYTSIAAIGTSLISLILLFPLFAALDSQNNRDGRQPISQDIKTYSFVSLTILTVASICSFIINTYELYDRMKQKIFNVSYSNIKLSINKNIIEKIFESSENFSIAKLKTIMEGDYKSDLKKLEYVKQTVKLFDKKIFTDSPIIENIKELGIDDIQVLHAKMLKKELSEALYNMFIKGVKPQNNFKFSQILNFIKKVFNIDYRNSEPSEYEDLALKIPKDVCTNIAEYPDPNDLRNLRLVSKVVWKDIVDKSRKQNTIMEMV